MKALPHCARCCPCHCMYRSVHISRYLAGKQELKPIPGLSLWLSPALPQSVVMTRVFQGNQYDRLGALAVVSQCDARTCSHLLTPSWLFYTRKQRACDDNVNQIAFVKVLLPHGAYGHWRCLPASPTLNSRVAVSWPQKSRVSSREPSPLHPCHVVVRSCVLAWCVRAMRTWLLYVPFSTLSPPSPGMPSALHGEHSVSFWNV